MLPLSDLVDAAVFGDALTFFFQFFIAGLLFLCFLAIPVILYKTLARFFFVPDCDS